MSGKYNPKLVDHSKQSVTYTIFKSCAPFTDCITEVNNNTQVDNAKDLDNFIPTFNLIEYSINYSKTTEILYQICKDEPNDKM